MEEPSLIKLAMLHRELESDLLAAGYQGVHLEENICHGISEKLLLGVTRGAEYDRLQMAMCLMYQLGKIKGASI